MRSSLALILSGVVSAAAAEDRLPGLPSTADVISNAPAAHWRSPDPESLLQLEFGGGRVIIELAPDFAPEHVRNLRILARAGYWDGLAILRSQDNYVVQWGDPNAGEAQARTLGDARSRLPAEFERAAQGLPFARLADGDVYAMQVGWTLGFPVARDPQRGTTWLAHCYAMVGAGRDMAADSSNGAELYVVTGHAPRHLDRNITLVGRVLHGIEHLSSLPRGGGALGFYEDPAQRVPIRRVRLVSELPPEQRIALEVMRTESPSFAQLIAARRHRRESWFVDPVGRVELCNVPIPVRLASAPMQ